MARWTDEQLQSIETEGTNIIVSAGAGSGKTAVLTERVIQKLKKGIDIDSLLILTFTKAAAGEMKERIRASIKKEPSLKRQLDKIDASYITTFDSFALSTVKKYYYLLGIPMNLSIAEASIMTLTKERLMDDVFEEMYATKNSDFQKFISDFCLKDDKELREHVLKLNEKLDLLYDKDNYLNTYIENYFTDNHLKKDIERYVTLLQSKVDTIKVLVRNLEQMVDSDYINKVNDSLKPLFSSHKYEEFKNSINIEFPRLPNGSTDEIKKKKEQIVKEIKSLNDFTVYEDEQTIKNDILSTLPYVKSIIKIIQKFDEKLNIYKKENDMYEFIDIAKLAIKVVDTYPEAQNEMKSKFSEILLDEYQDTSDLQEKFISCIARNNVYMVGDIKQSIYRFRNANPYIFKNKYDTYKKHDGGIKIDLMKNFRSRKEVLENINEIFDHVMDNEIGGAEYQDGHQMIFGNMSYEENGKTKDNHNFEFYTYAYEKDSKYKKEEIEIFTIANDIQNKIKSNYQVFDKDNEITRPIEYKDFVILLDRSKNFTLYKKIFEYMGIPLMVYQDESLRNGYDLDIIKNLIKLIIKEKNHTYDTEFKYAFISIARSYLVNIEDNIIFKCLRDETYKELDFMKKVSILANNIDTFENTEIIKQILQEFNFYEKIITIGNVEESLVRMEYIINLSKNLSMLGYDIYDISKYLEDVTQKELDIKYSMNTSNNSAVKIMTIHKSKGLEYHVCYFPGLYETFNTLEVKDRFCYDKEFGIILPVSRNGIKSTIYKKMYKEKYLLEEIGEKIRLFYVALTRAKEKMIFVGNIKDMCCETNQKRIIDTYTRSHYTSFLDIVNSIKMYIEPYIVNIDLDKIPLTKEYNFTKETNYKENIQVSGSTFTVEELQIDEKIVEESHYSKENHQLLTKDSKKNMEFGTYIHSLLEMIDFENPRLDNFPVTPFYKKKIDVFLSQDIFKKRIKNIYKEYEFIYEENLEKKHGIIDLIIQYDDGYAIVDYKTKEISDIEYRHQLEGYKKYIEKITNQSVDIYIYSILDETLKKL